MIVLFYLYGLFSLEITRVITDYHGLPQITTGYFHGKILDKYLKTYVINIHYTYFYYLTQREGQIVSYSRELVKSCI